MEPKRLTVTEQGNTVAFQWWNGFFRRFNTMALWYFPAAFVSRFIAVLVAPEQHHDLAYWVIFGSSMAALVILIARAPRHTLILAPGKLTNSNGLSLDLAAIREIEVNNETDKRNVVTASLVQAWVRDASDSHQLVTLAHMFTRQQADAVAEQLTRRLELRSTTGTPLTPVHPSHEPLPVIAYAPLHHEGTGAEQPRAAHGWDGPVIGMEPAPHEPRLHDHA